jgi:hypothetical protein
MGPAMAEHSRQPALCWMRSTFDPNGQMRARRLCPERAGLLEVAEAVEDHRVVVTPARFDDQSLKSQGESARRQPLRSLARATMAEDGSYPTLLLGDASRLCRLRLGRCSRCGGGDASVV